MSRWGTAKIVFAAALVLTAGGIWLAIETGTPACTKVGCVNRVSFDASTVDDQIWQNAETVTICANSACETSAVGQIERPLVATSLDDRVVRSASLTVVDAGGKELLHAELAGEHKAKKSTPNGADCEPTCWFLELAVVDGSLTAA